MARKDLAYVRKQEGITDDSGTYVIMSTRDLNSAIKRIEEREKDKDTQLIEKDEVSAYYISGGVVVTNNYIEEEENDVDFFMDLLSGGPTEGIRLVHQGLEGLEKLANRFDLPFDKSKVMSFEEGVED